MNIPKLQQEMENVIKSLGSAMGELDTIEASRIALQNSDYALTLREKNIYGREVTIKKTQEDIEAQKKYIEEQQKNSQMILDKITMEKELLKGLAEKKKEIEKEKGDLEIAKKEMEGLREEKGVLQGEWENLLKQKQLFEEEKRVMIEQTKLIAIKQANIKSREERIDKIERMTEV